MFFLNSRERNCSIFPFKIMSFGSGFLKSLAKTVVSFNKIGRRVFGEKKRRPLLNFVIILSKIRLPYAFANEL